MSDSFIKNLFSTQDLEKIRKYACKKQHYNLTDYKAVFINKLVLNNGFNYDQANAKWFIFLNDLVLESHRSSVISLHLNSDSVRNEHRKLKAVWSVEAQEDLRSIHNMAYSLDAYMDSGYIYAPYVPLAQSPPIIEEYEKIMGKFAVKNAEYKAMKNAYIELFNQIRNNSNILELPLPDIQFLIVNNPELANDAFPLVINEDKLDILIEIARNILNEMAN